MGLACAAMQSRTNVDYTEKAVVVINDNVDLKNYSIPKLLKSFFRTRSYSRKELEIDIQLHEPRDEDNFKAYIITTCHHKFSDSIIEWDKKFHDFIDYFRDGMPGDVLMIKVAGYEGDTKYILP